MPLNIQGDTNQGYLQINGSTAVTVTSTGITTASIQDSAITTAKLAQPLTLATSVASTSGTAIDFTGIPSWAKKITVMFNGVSTNGNDAKLIQLGTSSGFLNSSYNGASSYIGTSASVCSNFTTGIGINLPNASNIMFGNVVITLQNNSDNTWVAHGVLSISDSSFNCIVAGSRTLSSILTQIRVTTTGGTNTFDAGSINIMYEG